jgi:GTPase SAR1 family protein
MSQTQTLAKILADRLCRPQRIGVFGRRGVGKTTFVTMLYREAVGGRLPELRLAAADARTADYLSDKILQLEGGQPLPATLAETDLSFHLYHHGNRLDLLLKDYQGEHVAVGREEPIREFLRDCDAVWLCLDVTAATAADTCLHSEQEVEQLVEDYLSAAPEGTPHRPMALVLTKTDLLEPEERITGPTPDPSAVQTLVEERFRMTRHALASHVPQHALLAVSSLGHAIPTPEQAPAGQAASSFNPQPVGLADTLTWLSTVLQAQDEARLQQIWQLAPNNLLLLQRCVACFARRYPDTETTRTCKVRLRQLRQRLLLRRGLIAAGAACVLLLSLWTYDALGARGAEQFARDYVDQPAVVRDNWLTYQSWHPTRHWFGPDAQAEQQRLHELDEQIHAQQIAERLADLRRRAADPDLKPETGWEMFKSFREDFPDYNIDADMQQFRIVLKERYDAERERKAQAAYDELLRQEAQTDLAAQIARAERFLREFGDTTRASYASQRLAGYLKQLDERAYEVARAYSGKNPFNYHTRREHYQAYLQRHPSGAFVKDAHDALAAIEAEWDKHDFRAVRDHFNDKPGELKELDVLCRAYLAAHPNGRFKEPAVKVLRWSENARVESEYKVTLKNGSFDPKSKYLLSRGLYLSVEIEVNGVTYGPSTIVKRDAEPEWDYEFPKRIKWKTGDSVKIKVTDNYYWRRAVVDFSSADGDPLAMKMLSGTTCAGKNCITFESDFGMPVLPKIE